jgi:hypothetical protein
MDTLIQTLIQSADAVPCLVDTLLIPVKETVNPLIAEAVRSLLSAAAEPGILPVVGGGVSMAFASTAVTYSDIPEETFAAARRWHGTIDEQYSNVDKLVVTIQAHSAWGTPSQFSQVTTSRTQLSTLIPKCRSSSASGDDRGLHNFVLKTTVGLCLGPVKAWAYAQYYANILTLADLHSLGFLLPGETGGRHDRTVATNVVAEVKVSVLSADMIRVTIDQAAGENAALVAHGWPPGVHQALIVITSVDGREEIYRQHTTRLHNEIEMPEGSHGKQFIIKAAFLRHVDDRPKFGPQPTFSMPLTTEDLIDILDRQHHEEYEAHIREVEHQRQELERLQAAAGTGQPAK